MMSSLSDFDFRFSIFISNKFSKKLFQRILAFSSGIFKIHHIFLPLFKDIALIFQMFIHGLILLGCINSIDRCKRVSHSVKDKHIFNMNQH